MKVSQIEKEKRNNKTVRKLFEENVANSTCQALLKIYDSPSILVKAFWATCLLSACSICSYFVVAALLEFFRYEVSVETRVHTETSSLFPKVTFCNKNLFTTKYAYDLANGSRYTDFVNVINFKLNESERDKLSHSLDDILLECQFNTQPCSSKDFVKEYDLNLGTCYSFNTGMNASLHRVPLRRSTRSGSTHGLRVALYVNVYEKLKDSYLSYLGAIVFIGNSSYKSTNFGIEQVPGVKANYVVDRFFEKLMPKPYSNCDIDNETPREFYSHLYDLILNSTFEYTQQMCYDLCQTKLILDQCECINLDRYAFFPNSKLCSSNDPCLQDLNRKFLSHDFIISSCLQLCPLQCNRTIYKTTISSSLLLKDAYISKVNGSISLREDFLNRASSSSSSSSYDSHSSIVKVYVFYETLTYVESNERAQSTSILTLASTIGGIMSLFLGVSVLSLFEVFDVFLEYYYWRL